MKDPCVHYINLELKMKGLIDCRVPRKKCIYCEDIDEYCEYRFPYSATFRIREGEPNTEFDEL